MPKLDDKQTMAQYPNFSKAGHQSFRGRKAGTNLPYRVIREDKLST
jgi:hypothetical protein